MDYRLMIQNGETCLLNSIMCNYNIMNNYTHIIKQFIKPYVNSYPQLKMHNNINGFFTSIENKYNNVTLPKKLSHHYYHIVMLQLPSLIFQYSYGLFDYGEEV